MADVTTPVPDGTSIGLVVDGKLLGRNLLNDTAGADAMGLVDPAPAANTLLGRLKAIYDKLAATLTIQGAVTTDAATSATYVPVTLGSANLAGGACRAIVAEVAGRVNLKQPDGTVRANYPLHVGENSVKALAIDVPTSGTAATGVWALY